VYIVSYNNLRHIFAYCIATFLLDGQVVAQEVTQVPRDTSFTVHSAFLKERKKFPYIKIIKPLDFDSNRMKKDIVYSSFEKTIHGHRKLHLDLFKPDDDKRLHAAVLLLHGGGWSSGNKSHMFPLAQALANSGFVAFAIEYRLSDEAIFPAAVIDVKNAIRWVRENYSQLAVDTNKIAVLGCSAGAQLAGLVAATNDVRELNGKDIPFVSTTVNAVVSIDGIVSFIHPEASAEGAAASKWLGGTRTTNPKNWRSASALEYANNKTPPFSFINSSIPRFHAGRDDFIEKMTELGIYTEVHTIQDTPHTFWLFDPWFEQTSNLVVSYLNKIFDQ
jgi:pectinesterase